MKIVLFLVLPFPSHYNSCFGLAASLRERGCRVVFTGIKSLQDYVQNQEFEFAALQYIDEPIIANWRGALGSFIASRLDKQFIRKRYRDFLYAVQDLYRVCQDIKPDEIYIDDHLNHYYCLLNKDWPSIILINSKLPTRCVKGIPPLTCSVPVKNIPLHRLYCRVLWKTYLLQRSVTKWITRAVLSGLTDTHFIERETKNRATIVRSDPANAFYDGLINVPIIHLVPPELEYTWYELQSNERFAFYQFERKPHVDTSLFWTSLEPILKRRSSGQTKLIYVSMGTLSAVYAQPAIQFIRKIIAAVEGMLGVHLLISANGFRTAIPKTLPEYISFYDWVPQPELLAHCDLMITHGGMNSVCECLIAGVPMLVYPLNLRVDQSGNAARVVAHGWGRQGSLRNDRKQIIQKAIQNLLIDTKYRQRVVQARDSILSKELMVS